MIESASAYIPMDRRQALARDEANDALPSETLPERSEGVALFADISGFTPLTAALAEELGAQRGAEELTQQLNRVYGLLIAEVHRYHGSVINFSGDAITCWFDGERILGALACAFAMQQRMRQLGRIVTPIGTPIRFAIKVAVVAGPVRRFVVGQPEFRWIDVLAGYTLDRVSEAEKVAKSGEIVVSSEIVEALGKRLVVDEWRNSPGSLPKKGKIFAVVSQLTGELPPSPWPALSAQALSEQQVSAWLLPQVYGRLQSGQGHFLAELRPAAALFGKFRGIDYDEDEQAGAKLDAYIDWVQGILDRYEGALIQLTVGDKGSYFYATFGTLRAHDDDAARALATACALRVLPPELHFIQGIQIGIAWGQMRCGAYGSPTRRTYGALGDKTNLAARLMGLAELGDIRCDAAIYRRASTKWAFEALPPVRIKGKTGLVPLYRPLGRLNQPTKIEGTENRMIGRKAEVERLALALDALEKGKSHTLLIEGEAGIGKSRLVAQLMGLVEERRLTALLGVAHSIEQQTPYRAWHDIFREFFKINETLSLAEVYKIVQRIAPEQLERLPLLNDFIALELPESKFTASLPLILRKKNLVLLLVALLQAFAKQAPLVIVLEDAHWLDSLSWELATSLAYALLDSMIPLLFVLVTRPLHQHHDSRAALEAMQALELLATTQLIRLTSLSNDETVELVNSHLGLPAGGLPKAIAALIHTRAGGNPFFAEELVLTLHERGLITIEPDPTQHGLKRCLISGDLTLASQTLPDTLHGLILARIDRLPPDKQLTLKIAAVIGRNFAYIPLSDLLNRYTNIAGQTLKSQLQEFVLRDLAVQEMPEPDLSYVFKHIITQEVAYQTLLFAQRRQLHHYVAEWYEQYYLKDDYQSEAAKLIIPLLVHHYHHAEEKQQERDYAKLAGEQAAARFANLEALAYFSRALSLSPPEEGALRYELLLAREKLYHLQGERQAQLQDLQALAELAERLGDNEHKAEVHLRYAYYAEVISNYPKTIANAQQAIQITQDAIMQAAAYRQWGRALLRQGYYPQAEEKLLKALALCEEVPTSLRAPWVKASTLHNLGMVCRQQGNYESAQAYYEQALTIERTIGNRRGEGATLGNLGLIFHDQGEYTKAKHYYKQDLHITRTIGDRRGEGITLFNLAKSSHAEADYAQARSYYEQSLHIRREINDQRGTALVLAYIGLLYHHLEDHEMGAASCTKALAISKGIGSLYVEGYILTFLAHSLVGLGELDKAMPIYQQALTLRQEMGLPHLAMESLAGLARIALLKEELEQATAYVKQILSYLESNPTLGGTEDPQRIYLTCSQVLQAKQPPSPPEVVLLHF